MNNPIKKITAKGWAVVGIDGGSILAVFVGTNKRGNAIDYLEGGEKVKRCLITILPSKRSKSKKEKR